MASELARATWATLTLFAEQEGRWTCAVTSRPVLSAGKEGGVVAPMSVPRDALTRRTAPADEALPRLAGARATHARRSRSARKALMLPRAAVVRDHPLPFPSHRSPATSPPPPPIALLAGHPLPRWSPSPQRCPQPPTWGLCKKAAPVVIGSHGTPALFDATPPARRCRPRGSRSQ